MPVRASTKYELVTNIKADEARTDTFIAPLTEGESMRTSRREFVKLATASGIALSLSRLGWAQEASFDARETLPGRNRWNPAATGVGRIDSVPKVTGAKLYASD